MAGCAAAGGPLLDDDVWPGACRHSQHNAEAPERLNLVQNEDLARLSWPETSFQS